MGWAIKKKKMGVVCQSAYPSDGGSSGSLHNLFHLFSGMCHGLAELVARNCWGKTSGERHLFMGSLAGSE